MYDDSFYITNPVSNNSFSYQLRANKKLYVPTLIEGTLQDVHKGEEIVFEDFDDEGQLRSCKGLEKFVKIAVEVSSDKSHSERKIPAYVFDNHNHAFAFWHQEWIKGGITEGALLIHVDAHKDTRIPESFLPASDAKDSVKIYEYTNTVLNVGNFIPAAQKTGLVKDIIFIDSEASIEAFDFAMLKGRQIIFDIDLDFFAPELDYIGNQKKLELIKKILPHVHIITFATSPFFIEQDLALLWLHKILL